MKRHLHVVAIAAIAGALAAGAVQSLFSAVADQSERVPPTSGIYTGVQFSQLIGDAVRSISTGNKGATAPANVGGSAVDGLEWIDDSVTPWLKKRFVGGGWAVEGALDPSDSSYVGVIGGGVASLASASTVDLGSVPQANVSITGTTTINGFGSSAPVGIVKIIRFAAALTLANSSSLAVPGGFSLVTAANDRAIVTHLGSGNWEVTHYTRASGVPVDIAAVGEVKFNFASAVPALSVAAYGQALSRATYPAYFAKVTRAQNGTRISGNATITSVADTSGMGAGMPVEGSGINAGCTIAAVTSSSIQLNSSSCVTSSGTSTVTVFLTGYGSGGDATTVGVPDCRGRGLAGRDHNLPGSLANRLTTNWFGSNSAVMAVANGFEFHTLTEGEMPQHSHGVNDPGHRHEQENAASKPLFGSAPNNPAWAGLAMSNTSIAFTGITIQAAGGGNPHAIVDPTLIAECTVRVTP
jgi:microcystin-dependent protein